MELLGQRAAGGGAHPGADADGGGGAAAGGAWHICLLHHSPHSKPSLLDDANGIF